MVVTTIGDIPGYERANAIIAMRFDTSEMKPNRREICAYGTAVRARRASSAASWSATR
jgi:hypothetical protein